MSAPTLVILAAGMASRYGSMKQIEGFGPHGETIIEYSIYDAIRAGFGKVVFIIREEFAEPFKNIFEPKLKGKIQTEYVYQSLDKFTDHYAVPAERTKPWGTAHAVLCTKGIVNEPFAVINADDYYGAAAFQQAYDFLTTICNEETYCILGYELSNTLSDNGTVSRGVCTLDNENYLTKINECTKIYRAANGQIVFEENGIETPLKEDTRVSMNFMCFAPGFINLCEREFALFLQKQGQELKSEFFIPVVAGRFTELNLGKVKVIPTNAKWFGVTYKEDAPGVKACIDQLVSEKVYPTQLW
ncbi:MAG: sugar phosphate nucleotidyltransferase [Bacteroidetes bacterium]|nr:sugar phosphate nucleotidyltransferase [Bacteroidota bacterium]